MADETTLISRTQNGDELAFADLVRRYHAFVYAIVIGIMKDSDEAEEVVQDTFVNAYRGLPQLENAAKFKGWLAEIARNCVRDRLRGQRVDIVSINEVSDDTLQAPGSLDAQLIRDEQRALILSAMESLSGKDKEIVKGYYLDGASYEELIRTHGLSYKAISVRLSRAKRKLAKRLRHLLPWRVCFSVHDIQTDRHRRTYRHENWNSSQNHCWCGSHYWNCLHRDSPISYHLRKIRRHR